MSEPDILVRLRDCIGYTLAHKMDGLTTALNDARDEIVTLREQLATMRHAFDDMEPSLRSAVAESVRVAQKRIRAEALEEAARIVESARGEGPVDLRTLVHEIRWLKERGDG